MGILFVAVVGLAVIAVAQYRRIAELQRELETVRAEKLVSDDEHKKQVDRLDVELEKLEAENEKLDRENYRVHKENELRREYAYVCRECKQVDPVVQAARERTLRSVTKR